jgi:hypothetical protein
MKRSAPISLLSILLPSCLAPTPDTCEPSRTFEGVGFCHELDAACCDDAPSRATCAELTEGRYPHAVTCTADPTSGGYGKGWWTDWRACVVTDLSLACDVGPSRVVCCEGPVL